MFSIFSKKEEEQEEELPEQLVDKSVLKRLKLEFRKTNSGLV